MGEEMKSTMETSGPLQQATMNVLSMLRSPTLSEEDWQQVAADVVCLRVVMVNVCLFGDPAQRDGDWVLIDAALPNTAGLLEQAAQERFGSDQPPKAIILTHGHFDHVGAIIDLVEKWGCPVYAHEKELPYLTGQANYPPASPEVDPGLMAKLSPLYPRSAINLGDHVQALPQDGSVPYMPGWRWLHTPGHTPGHVSLFREEDRVLIAGDAIITVKQESALAVLTQDRELHGPPEYFTPDWLAAKASVKRLAD